MKLLVFLLVIWGTFAVAETNDVKKFREARVESLKKNWLVVVGLTWLKEGENALGSATTATVILPKSAPEKFGRIVLHDKKAVLQLDQVQGIQVDGQAAQAGKSYPLKTDESGQPTKVAVGTVSFYLIARPNGIGVRIKDTQAETLQKFQGLQWWDEKPEYRVVGHWKKLEPPRELLVPDVLGNLNHEKINGSVVFTLNGKKLELFPTRSGNDLFFVFKDQTTGKASYGTGRFLDAEVAKDETVILDFNRAYNPPCAYILYATCPIAPAENKLDVAIEAGEKKPPGH